MRLFLLPVLLGLSACLSLAGCGDDEKVYEVTDVRDHGRARMPAGHGLSDAQRLGLEQRGASGAHAAEPAFTWKTPAGWEEQAAAGMRKGSWKIAGQPETDCSLIMLQGQGGDALSNVNRWRDQMGLEPIDAKAMAALPRLKMMDRDAAYMNVVGVYGGMKGDSSQQNARMLGLVAHLPMVAVFLKFVGPEAVVAAEAANFEALAASLKFGAPKQKTPAAAHGGNPRASRLQWDAPKGWEQKPPKMMREVTFAPAGTKKTECFVTILGGAAGGTEANINRWMEQMQQKPLSSEDIAKLPRLDVMGKKAAMVTIGGKYVGMGEANVSGAMMYALVCERPDKDDVVFVKMTGPASEMKPEKAAFEAFCKSLR